MAAVAANPDTGRRVLLVEDDPAICGVISDLLNEIGLQTICVHTDRQAYDMLPTLPAFSAVLVDVNLGPGTTGFDVARFARRLNASLPVVYLSGSPEEWATWFGVDNAAFHAKPVTDAELIDTVARLTGRGPDPVNPMPKPA